MEAGKVNSTYMSFLKSNKIKIPRSPSKTISVHKMRGDKNISLLSCYVQFSRKMAPSFIKKALTKIQNIPDKRGKVATALNATALIAKGVGAFVPLAGMVGSALSVGATMLESPPDEVQEDLMNILKEMKVENAKYESEIAKIQDVVNLSFRIVVDLKYKVKNSQILHSYFYESFTI